MGYVIAARGELEYEKNGEKIRFKNLKPSKIKEIIDIIDARKDD
jgi:hydroxymethylpyrimidine pyrophosphatase-like HAD family hydrolase